MTEGPQEACGGDSQERELRELQNLVHRDGSSECPVFAPFHDPVDTPAIPQPQPTASRLSSGACSGLSTKPNRIMCRAPASLGMQTLLRGPCCVDGGVVAVCRGNAQLPAGVRCGQAGGVCTAVGDGGGRCRPRCEHAEHAPYMYERRGGPPSATGPPPPHRLGVSSWKTREHSLGWCRFLSG